MKHLEFRAAATLSSESLFAAKYNWLFGWAMHFAQGDRATAEDLLHDTFVRFVVAKPDLKKVENVEALLYTYLKYSHLAHLRRLQRYPSTPLSFAEFDSLQLGLRKNIATADPVETQDALWRIAAYLTWRKDSAKSASMLILRFFLGYYPDEIMCIARTSGQAVRKRLQEARQEAELYLSAPGRLRIMHQAEPPETIPQHLPLSSEQVIPELQKFIFAACHTECLPENLLLERYQAENSKPIERELLAHIVSCKRCLALVSRLCGIAPPSDRSPEESLGPDRRSRGGSKQSPSSGNDVRRALRIGRDRVREAYEHQPRRLAVAVNGAVLATHDVSSSWSMEVKPSAETAPEFIEVISEQGVCLLAMHIAARPPDAPPELRHEVELSQGRRIEVQLQFTSVGPLVEVAYYDPSFLADAVQEAAEADDQRPVELTAPLPAQRVKEKPALAMAGGFWPCWQTWAWRNWLGKLAIPKLNPVFAAAASLTFAVVLLAVLWPGSPSKPHANDLLTRAVAAHTEGTAAAPYGVICQKIQIRTSKRTLTRTIYRDAQGLRQPKPERLTPEDAQLQTDLVVADVNWDDPLSPVTYREWHDRRNAPQNEISPDEVRRSGDGLLTLTTTSASGIIARESLTLRERDFHVIARTVEFRDTETIEIAELDYSVMPWGAPTEPFFEPPSRRLVSDASSHPVFLPLLGKAELDEAELQARLTLNQLHADTGLRIKVERKPTGILVNGIVESAQRKRELETRLNALPHVRPSIFTLGEMRRSDKKRTDAYSRQYSYRLKVDAQQAQSSPLEAYLVARGWTVEPASALSRQLLDSANTVAGEGRTLSDLLLRFGPGEPLTATAQAALQELLRNHAANLSLAAGREEALLARAGLQPKSSGALLPSAGPFLPSGETSLLAITERSRALADQLALANGNSTPNSAPPPVVIEFEQSIQQTLAAVHRLTANLPSSQRFNAQR
jgi:DNA-directed RNA polymerase specialized sigma24 family protein